MGAIANTDAQDMLRAKFGTTDPAAKPLSWEVVLSSTLPTVDLGTGAIVNVTVPTGVTWPQIANTDAEWSITGRKVANVTSVSIAAGASGFGVCSWALLRDPTTSRYMGFGRLSKDTTGATDETLILAPGTLTVTIPTA